MGGIGKKNIILAIAILIACVHTAESNGDCKNAACPPYNGISVIVPHPTECESFCVCTCDGAIYMPCPAGLHYNEECHMCDWPSHAGCDPTPHPSTPSGGTTTGGGSEGGGGSTAKPPPTGSCDKVKPLCPHTNTGNATLLPNPDDCGSYCVCDWGNAIWRPCPEGLHFNPIKKICDYPENAGCDPSATASTPGGGGGGSTGGGGGGSTAKPPPTGSCDKVKPLCPPTNTGNATLLPNPDDCGSYCVCDWGNAIWRPCPEGLHFNPIKKICDYPENAGCDPSATASTPGGGGGGSTGGGGGGSTAKPPPTGSCDKVKPLCPTTNTGNATLLPNPDDCGSYCVCDWGNAIWRPCPEGLHFNPIKKICDYPENAGCDPSATASTPGGGGGGSTGGGGGGSTAKPPPTGSCDKVKPLCPPTNTGNATLLPNPDDCGSYCVCDWGNAIWRPCPEGLHFNPIKKICDYPENAGCDPSATASTPGGGGGGSTGGGGGGSTAKPPPTGSCDKVKPLCPPTNTGNATLLPNPDDCGSYCVCDWGNAIWRPCPEGLHFNPIKKICDYPENAGCDPSATASTPGGGGGGSTGGGGGGSTAKPPPTGSCDKVKPLCPPTNTGNATLLPNPDDCGSYCVCDWGNAIWRPCPEGLHFNPIKKICDYPENAGCDPSATASTPGGGGGGSTGGGGGGSTAKPPPTGSCDKVKPLCPPTNTGNATLLPNPDDCGSYCVCDWGNAIWWPCPEGLHFNPIKKICDYPENAGCDPSATASTPGGGGGGSTGGGGGGSTAKPPPTGSCDKVKPLCPPTNTGNATLLPNPDDCGSYCVCDWGNAIWWPCPEGLHFNPIKKICDYPENAGCDPSATASTPGGGGGGSTGGGSGGSTAKPPPTGSCDKVKPLCPPTNTGNATLLPNPDDCGSYCVCDWGNAIWRPCPEGLHFNPIKKICDYPENAGCDPSATASTPGGGGGGSTGGGGGGSTAKPPPTGSCDKVKPLCPPTNTGNATLLPNPDDCGSYCVCDWGNAIWMPCPAGLHFNPILRVCDYPENAGCDPSAKPSTPGAGGGGGGSGGGESTSRPTGTCDEWMPLCPPVNGFNATLIPNPIDCGSYCVCDWGRIFWMPCPDGLHFNPTLKVCDYPDVAGCILNP